MKRSIATRLMLSSILILAIALVSFFAFTTYTLNRQVYETTLKQLRMENEFFARTMFSDSNPKGPFWLRDESESKHFVYAVEPTTGESFISLYSRKAPVMRDQQAFLQAIESFGEGPGVLEINQQKYVVVGHTDLYHQEDLAISPYFFEQSLVRRFGETTQIKLVSIMPYQQIATLTKSNSLSFLLLLGVLFVFAAAMIRREAKRITEPIVSLSTITKEYANRCFDTTVHIHTGDEIEELACSIHQMVTNLVGYEKAQSELFRKLSHELKTPLTAISGCAEAIENGYYEATDEPLRIIQEESMRMKHLLEDLILLTKMDANAEIFTFEPYELTALIAQVAEKVEPIAIMQEMDLCYEPIAPIHLQGDVQKLMRAFINVVGNALRYARESVWIKLMATEEAVVITIQDDGPGFDEAVRDKLFVRAVGESIDGSGIGLLIVYEIIKRHQGDIRVYNHQQGGACVEISLPKAIR